MTDLTTVSAVAIVRARDGSSIVDWEEDSGVSADHYLADPDRIRAAIRALEEGGLTVKSIGDVTITCSGSTALMSAMFGGSSNTINTDDFVNPSWRSTGGPVLALPVGHLLSAQLASIRLESAPSLEQRSYLLEEASDQTIRPRDLLVGDVGQTLGSSVELPDRLNGSTAVFPQLNKIEIRTRESIKNWKGKLEKTRPKTLKNTQRRARVVKRHRQTFIDIIEFRGGLRSGKLLADYEILGDTDNRMVVKSTISDPKDIYRINRAWTVYHGPMAEAVLEWLAPAIRRVKEAAKELSEKYQTFTSYSGETEEIALRAALKAMAVATSDVAVHLKYLQRKGTGRWKRSGKRKTAQWVENSQRFSLRKDGTYQFTEDLSKVDADELMAKSDALSTMGSGRVWGFDQLLDLTTKINEVIKSLKLQLMLTEPLLRVARQNALITIELHAQMVVFAVNGVTLGSVPAVLRGADHEREIIWDRVDDNAGAKRRNWNSSNRVMSASLGWNLIARADWSSQRKLFRKEWGVRLTDRRTLHLLAVGNHQQPGGSLPTTNVFLSGATNVILVGGCEPDFANGQVVWKASDATQGYGYRVGGSTHHVPDICATTKGDRGGAMIYPAQISLTDDSVKDGVSHITTWWTGGGSSLSCPVVAAAAGLVWTYFPEFDAPEMKEILLASAVPLAGGAFHVPSGLTATEQNKVLVVDSNRVGTGNPTDHPAGRIHLWKAVTEASQRYKVLLGSSEPWLRGRRAEGGR